MKHYLLLITVLFPGLCYSAEWQFSEPVKVSDAANNIFHHLGASGRRAIASSEDSVAIVWEDNRDGKPGVYASIKKHDQAEFTQVNKVSGTGEAYEPGIIALHNGSFLIGWEEQERLHLRVIDDSGTGTIIPLSVKPSRQISMFTRDVKHPVVVWAEKLDRFYQVHFARLQVTERKVRIDTPRRVDDTEIKADQLYPDIYQSGSALVVGWEDRRFGNTRIFTSFSQTGERFSAYQLLNDFRPSRIARFGHGTGAMRISLGGDGKNLVVASWLDKRDFEGGYDVYAAVSEDGGKTFATDELVQDVFGENTPQWHNAVAVSEQGKIVVLWDDTRDGPPRIWFSERRNGKWSSDINVADTDEGIKESHPVVCFDQQGRLHIAFLRQAGEGSEIVYIQGRSSPP